MRINARTNATPCDVRLSAAKELLNDAVRLAAEHGTKVDIALQALLGAERYCTGTNEEGYIEHNGVTCPIHEAGRWVGDEANARRDA